MSDYAIVPGSLTAIAQRDGASLAESFANAEVVIICDVSGSMQIEDSRNNRSRYDVELEELAKLQATMPGKIAVLAFSDNVEFVPGGVPPMMGQRTMLDKALKFAKIADVSGMRFILISDGCPDQEGEALAIAATYKNRIDCIYVGPEAMPEGRDFLLSLSRLRGGVQVTADRAKELCAAVQQLLLGW
jgi:hypothetical protein